MATHEAEIIDNTITSSSADLQLVDVKYRIIDARDQNIREYSSTTVSHNDSGGWASSSKNSVPFGPGTKVAAITKVFTPTSEYLLLVAAFKPAVGSFCLELPTGPMLQNQTAQDAAKAVVKNLTNCPASAPLGARVSPQMPLYADLCSDSVAMVELHAHVKEAALPAVVATSTQEGEPIHIVHVTVNHFLDSVAHVASSHGFQMSSHVYALGFQLGGAMIAANMHQPPPPLAHAPPAPGNAMVGIQARQAAGPPIHYPTPPQDILGTVTRRVKRVSLGILCVAAVLVVGSRWNDAEDKKAKIRKGGGKRWIISPFRTFGESSEDFIGRSLVPGN